MSEETRPGEVSLAVDPVNESIVIAAAMAADEDERHHLIATIPADSFFEKRYQAAWSAFAESDRRHLAFDLATIRTLGRDVDVEFLAKLAEMRPNVPENLAHHVETLRWDRARATAWTGPVSGLVQAMRDPRTDPDKVRALARQIPQAFEGASSRTHLHDGEKLVRDQIEDIKQRREGRAVYPFGIDSLDVDQKTGEPRLVPGAAPGKITVVTGVSGSGKSTVTGSLILGMARQQRRVLVGAWENSGGQTLELLAALSLGWGRTKVNLGRMNDEEIVQFEVRMLQIAEWVTFMKNPFGRHRGEKSSNERNLDLVHGYIADTGADVFVADLWQRCLVDKAPDEEESALYRQQSMAEETRCHVVIVHQQRLKDVENRSDKRPTREGIKGSGAYVEVADTMLAPHRPALFKNVPDNKLEIIVLKQRFARWPICVEFDYDADRGSFVNGNEVDYQVGAVGGDGSFNDFMRSGKKARRAG